MSYRITWPATDTAGEVVESYPDAVSAYAARLGYEGDPAIYGRQPVITDPNGKRVALVGPSWAVEIIELNDDTEEVRA